LLGGTSLPETLRALMQDLGVPTGIRELGYDEDDIPALVEGAMAQQRLLVGSPREVSEDDLAEILRRSL
jgi:alcohol dehydrogenase class IV